MLGAHVKVTLSQVLFVLAALFAQPHSVGAHQRLVGMVDARATPDAVLVLIKLDARMLLTTTGLAQGTGEPSSNLSEHTTAIDAVSDGTRKKGQLGPAAVGAGPRELLTSRGKRAVWRLLRKTHWVESWKGRCVRVALDKYELTQDGAWLDIHARYHCASPRHYVLLHVQTLLEEPGHRIAVYLDSGDGDLQRRSYNHRVWDHFLLPEGEADADIVSAAEPVTAERLPPTPGAGLPLMLARPEIFLLPLILIGSAGDLRLRFAAALGALLVAASVAAGLEAVPLTQWLAGPSTFIAMLGTGTLAARFLIWRVRFSWVYATATGLVAACGGCAAAGAGGLSSGYSPASLLVLLLAGTGAGLVGWLVGRGPRAWPRQAMALAVIAVLMAHAFAEAVAF